ncbi:MAG: hypothetical protein A3D24_01450 [Candidatus Blackburnbacteria bacterium RIFCSPHIGHO2_02_FULL_39_13]|uniref:M23ase beta-sheet core domain-containing protein n=1 Tax=Candidatus Blackburnbacteria bacterium RIFCSPLOWO2_01_FULL_40_20 TaxID=1797519 RepID=A0A1G1VFE0_9BACT|nr:MAG: M23/M37 family peptidase [Microgenomates group bacterium GW2011_GWA2_39_19]OGY06794.1 MAG: hypothetical protein A2694_00555 [Candidatus Blackburnbacteria bacterium RIFCSPHIGHO2_01_FULL_40_17]OGY09809.1 MAG: hypothetical protein A3D24_01450 [Candidatus Blackburnbacteria bacterium RIFCSPHIGHO2_02_FULL_39_13]OGY14089.1 MAG: hypothetical protein A3A77_03895 [Candidatus Blackburnbacteria bacterium RIFCSPLOWO2_01_FULL_40_20]HBL52294.1 hypothetical protein [Candidatus Blackburnbacteria bacteri
MIFSSFNKALLVSGIVAIFLLRLPLSILADEDDAQYIDNSYTNVGQQQGNESDLQKKLDENRQEQERVNKLLGETKQKKVTLQNEIVYQDNQIRLTILKIEETKGQIESLTEQINNLEGALTDLSKLYTARAIETYKLKRLGDSLAILLTANNITEFISRFNYLQRIQENDRQLLLKMQSTQSNFEDKRADIEKLKSKLEQQEKALENQKGQKTQLLQVTKNDEKKYQELLETLRADEDSIQKALSSLISRIVSGLATGSPVTKGQPIGLEGNTGNVFPRPSSSCPKCGAHLHYMVMPCDIVKNGGLSCHSDPAPYMDNGEYAKPMDFSNGWRIYLTQAYGNTSFAQSGTAGYSFHSGLDLSVSYGVAIRSVADGTVYYGTDSGGGKYALVKHRDDFWTAYWHLQ